MKEKKASSKIIQTIILLVLLVGLPLGSWYYLIGGAKWRKEAVAELGDYGKIREAWAIVEDGSRINLLEKKVAVLHIFGDRPTLTEENRTILDIYGKLAEQFGTSDDFRVVSIWSGAGDSTFNNLYNQLKEPRQATWLHTGGLGGWRTILENQYEVFRLKNSARETPKYLALADTSGTIRRFYNALDQAETARLIEHIAILLPRHD